jgi:hypothetical protein
LIKDHEPVKYVIGDPTDEQLGHLERTAFRHRVPPAKFFSFPSLRALNLPPRDRASRKVAQLM